MNSDEQNYIMYIKELETKLEERDKQLAIYESILEKFDSNLKLSIQSAHPISRNNICHKHITSKLFPTIKCNLKKITEDSIKNMLEEPHPATSHCVKLLVKTLQNETENHGQLILLTTSTFCKYMGDEGDIILGNISTVFDKICSAVYDHCQPTILKLCDKSQGDDVSDSEYSKDNNRYNNIMMFHNVKFKTKMLKELMPMLK